ncbi:MAG: ABC transporter substrate-binding protein [Actinomycetota bacterium]
MSLRALVPIAALSLLLAACGDGDDSDSAAAETSTGSASASAPAPETTETAETDSTDNSTSEGGETVSVTDVVGDKEVPVTESGIYALDELMGILLLTLGVEPDTTAAFFEDPLLAPVLEARSELVTAGSVESVAATQPELILGIGHPNSIEIHDDYAGIAPVVLPDFTASWQDQTRQIAQVVGRVDEGEAAIAVVEARVAQLAAEVEAAGLAGQQISIMQNFEGSYFAYGPTTISGSIAADLGFVRSEAQSSADNFGFIPISAELVPAETDVPIVVGVLALSADGLVSLFEDDLVSTDDKLAADVGDAWFNNTALGAWIVLDDLEAMLFDRGEIADVDAASGRFDELLAAIDAAG